MTPQRRFKAIDDYPSKFDWPGIKGLICKAEMQQASLLYYSAKAQSGAFGGVPYVIVHQNHSIPDVLSKLAERRSVLTVPCVVTLLS